MDFFYIGSGRRYTVALDPDAPATADLDVRGLWKAKTEVALALVLSDGDVDVTIGAPKLQLMAPQEGTRESKFIWTLTGQCNKNAGDDELSITSAAAA